jgi:hypothetical protein
VIVPGHAFKHDQQHVFSILQVGQNVTHDGTSIFWRRSASVTGDRETYFCASAEDDRALSSGVN